MGVPNMSLHIF